MFPERRSVRQHDGTHALYSRAAFAPLLLSQQRHLVSSLYFGAIFQWTGSSRVEERSGSWQVQHCVCLCRVVCSLWLVCACLALCPHVTTSKWEYFSKKPRSVKTGFNSRVGFYQAVAFEATAERAGWVLSNSVSGKIYCIVSAVNITNFFFASDWTQALGGRELHHICFCCWQLSFEQVLLLASGSSCVSHIL